MRTYLQTLVFFLLILVYCVDLVAQCNDSACYFSLNHALLTNIKQEKLLSPNEITIVNFSKVKNKYLISVAQDNSTEFARMFNIEFHTDSILGFFKIDNCEGILLGTTNPLINRKEIQVQPVWFVEGIKYRNHVFVDSVSLTEPLCFTKLPIIHYFLVNRRGRIIRYINHREMELSRDYYLIH